MMEVPNETADFLTRLCTDYRPSNSQSTAQFVSLAGTSN